MLQRTPAVLRAALFISMPAFVYAQAQEWKQIYSDSNSSVFVRIDSLKATKRGASAWIKIVFTKPQTYPEISNKPIASMVEKSEFSPTNKWTSRIIMYDTNGLVLSDSPVNASPQGSEIVPGSFEETVSREAIKLAAKPSSKKKNK